MLDRSRTAVSVRSNPATSPAERSPRWRNSTISASNSGVTERRSGASSSHALRSRTTADVERCRDACQANVDIDAGEGFSARDE
jgi:hypothetical protein